MLQETLCFLPFLPFSFCFYHFPRSCLYAPNVPIDPKLPNTSSGSPTPSTITMAYVPPALRKRAQGSAPDGTSGVTAEAAGSHDNLPPDTAPPKSIADLTFPQADIHHHYWPPRNDESGPSTTSTGSSNPSTLNSSAQAVDKLKYIMLFHDANPRWDSHGIIFVKSKLHILPGGEKFREDLLPDISRIRAEHSDDIGYERGASTQEKETIRGDASGANLLVKESQVGHKLLVSEDQSRPRQKHDDKKEEPSDEIEKNRGRSTESDQHEGTPPSNITHESRTKDAPNPDFDRDYEPNIEPPYSPDLTLYDTGPIAVFEQASRQKSGPFRFAGYYKIASLEYLAPHSRELLQLLEQKFTTVDRFGRARQQQRSAAQWKGSMRHRWAVISMERDQDADTSLPPPKIEVRNGSAGDADATSPRKTVNELLKEMRLKD